MSHAPTSIVACTRVPPLPLPRPGIEGELHIRPAVPADLPFIDALQKKHSKQLGYFPTKQLEGYVDLGGVLVAECQNPLPHGRGSQPVGYLISRDRYLKRDELGVVYQLCVEPGLQRRFVGAALLREAFGRSAYGCRLYCCWCAQDLAANRFWEAMGFVPLAFRGGSEKKSRVHIFWQKRIRKGDDRTPWWFPSKTDGGAMREDRLVLPIPLGLHWSEPMPVIRSEQVSTPTPPKPRKSRKIVEPAVGSVGGPLPPTRRVASFGPPPPMLTPLPERAAHEVSGPAKVVREKPKCDPRFVAVARELRDRWLEEVEYDPGMLLPAGKYEVARLPGARGEGQRQLVA